MTIQSHTLTIMLSDMVGFTAKTSRLSRDAMMAMLETHDELLRPIISHYNGRIVKTIGDAFMCVFESPTNAVLCAIRAQYVFRSYNKDRPENEQLNIRVALSSGEVQVTEDGDVFGEAVNVAARVEGVTPADEIYFTEQVYLSINRNEVPETLAVKRFNFKGIAEEITVYRVLQNTDNEVYLKIINTRIGSILLGPESAGEKAASPAPAAAVARQEPPSRKAQLWVKALYDRAGPVAAAVIQKIKQWSSIRYVQAGALIFVIVATLLIVRPFGRRRYPPTVKEAEVTAPIPARAAPAREIDDSVQQNGLLANYTRLLRSPDPFAQREAARWIISTRAYAGNPQLLEIAGEQLLELSQLAAPSRAQLGAINWLCNLLGEAAVPEYRPVLAKVAVRSPNARVRSYARSNLGKFR